MDEYVFAGLVSFVLLAVLAFIAWRVLKAVFSWVFMLAVNSAGAIALLLVLHYILEVDVPVNLPTLIITLLFGFPGVGTLLVLHYFGTI